MIATLDMAKMAKPQAAEVFSRFGEVMGVGVVRIGEGYGVKVNLRRAPNPDLGMPNNIAGVPVSISVVGVIRQQ